MFLRAPDSVFTSLSPGTRVFSPLQISSFNRFTSTLLAFFAKCTFSGRDFFNSCPCVPCHKSSTSPSPGTASSVGSRLSSMNASSASSWKNWDSNGFGPESWSEKGGSGYQSRYKKEWEREEMERRD